MSAAGACRVSPAPAALILAWPGCPQYVRPCASLPHLLMHTAMSKSLAHDFFRFVSGPLVGQPLIGGEPCEFVDCAGWGVAQLAGPRVVKEHMAVAATVQSLVGIGAGQQVA